MKTDTKVDAVTLDREAAEELAHFIEGSENASDRSDTVGLRLSVIGGGCAGFQYKLALAEPKEDDYVFESEDQRVLVDPVSMNFVAGSIITYRSGLDAVGFEVLNPRAETACGCGSSFAMKD